MYCARRGGGVLHLLCALPFNLCSQQNERLSRATQHPRLQHPADDSAPVRRGRGGKNKCGRERGRHRERERETLREKEKYRESKRGR